ncbi:PREDICTED: uncharacterized protein LOC106784254 [Polistes canadensis]|uniref:uncharacterized protein LOC106784254 n=1 Tax=Polistes canadensis TaxID=91411 RepID=UPI000718B353|nr:PREDICTED: uncharacterized protein LOC106784254 [Polistes canadensis]
MTREKDLSPLRVNIRDRYHLRSIVIRQSFPLRGSISACIEILRCGGRRFRDVAEHAGSFRFHFERPQEHSILRRKYLKDRAKGKQRGLDDECYCKKQEIADKSQYFHPSATSIIDHSSLHSSQSRKLSEEIENTNEKLVDRRSTNINSDIESPDKQRFQTNDLESQILSPDTQNAIENAEKILEEVQHTITEATLISSKSETKRRIKKKNWYSDNLQLEPPLEDEKEEALYIRELVSSKLQEIDQENSESNAERKEMLTTKIGEKRNRRISHLLDPKFQTVRRRSGDISYQHKNHCYVPNEQIESHHPKDKISDEMKKDDPVENVNRQKIKSLTIQKGPTLNIERKLKKQTIRFVNISPDASFLQNQSNTCVYEFRHNSCTSNKSLKDKLINRSEVGETNDEVDEISARSIDTMKYVRKDTNEDDNVIESDKKEYQSIWKNDDEKDLIDERKDDLSFENETNNGRREGNKDRETVPKHLPKTGVNDHFLSNTELNSSFHSDCIKNLTSEQRQFFIENVHSDSDTNTNKLLTENDIKDISKSLDDDNENIDNYTKKSTGNIQEEIRGDDIKLLKKKKTIDYKKSMKIMNKHEFIRNREKKIVESFGNICQKYNLRNKSSYKSKYDSTVSSNNSLEESDYRSFSELELNAPSIENFDDIFVHYDQMIERISKGEKKLEKMLEEFQLKLSIQLDKNKLSDNIEVTSCDIVALKSDDCKLMKLNPSKFLYKHKKDEESTLSLSDDTMIALPKRDKLQINSCITNDHLSLTNQFRNLKRRETSKVFTYPLEQKQNDLLIDTILTLNKSNLSSVDLNVENISDENKALDIFPNNDKATACVPLSTNYRSNRSNDPEDLRKDDKPNRTSFNNDEIIVPRISKFLLERQDQFVDRSSSERKINFDRSMVQDLMKHLQMFSNKYDHDIPTILQKFITDFANQRESDLFLNFLSIQKHDYENEKKTSSKTIVRDNECKMQIDDISNGNYFDNTACIPIQRQDKSIEIHPLNSIEIEDTKYLINKINQKEIQVSEKSTQYDISLEQNTLECENQIIEDICINKENIEQISEMKSEIEEYSLKQNEENDSNTMKIDSIANDDTYKRDMSSEINTVTPDLHLPGKIINKLSNGEDNSNTSNANTENILDTNLATTSSETSHSEGELYLPSSCSYSLGEVRVTKNSASVCNRALVSNSTLTCVYDTTSLLHYSSGEIVQQADSTDTF